MLPKRRGAIAWFGWAWREQAEEAAIGSKTPQSPLAVSPFESKQERWSSRKTPAAALQPHQNCVAYTQRRVAKRRILHSSTIDFSVARHKGNDRARWAGYSIVSAEHLNCLEMAHRDRFCSA
jgi:hypothetical protein